MKLLFSSFIFIFLHSINVFSQEIEHIHDIHYSFIENKGQWDKDILFQSKFNGGNLWIQQNKFVFHFQDFSLMQAAHAGGKVDKSDKLRQTVVHQNFVGSNEVNQIEKVNPTSNYYNYFLGKNSSQWASDVHGYSEAIMSDLYNGIDLKLIEEKSILKYEFHVKSNSNPGQIKIQYVGQKEISISKTGELIVETELGRIVEKKPYTYQIINGKIIEVNCSFQLVDEIVQFSIGNYNSNYELVIDPTLIFATYSGSVTDNFGMTGTYAHDGSAYSGGTIFGNAYPTPDNNAFDINSNFTVVNNPNYGVTDVFISKYNSNGTLMLWTSFIGGGDGDGGTETVHSLIADKNDDLYFFGATSSTDFPIQNGYQVTHAGGIAGLQFYWNGVYHLSHGIDIYVSKLSSNGHNLLGSTYIGGSGNDGINYKLNPAIYNSLAAYDSLTYNYGDTFRGEIMLDNEGNCIVASSSRSTDFPTLNAFQSSNAGEQDGVIFKLSSNLSNLMWSSYIGGSKNDACYSVKVDSSFNIVFSGGTCSSNLPNTSGSWKPNFNGGEADGFVGKLTPSGTVLTKVSYVGTPNYDQAYFVEIDRNDNVFLVGQSYGGDFPIVNSTFFVSNGSQFICKLKPDLSTPLNSTVFGNGTDYINISPSAFMVDICGNIYVSGWGSSIIGTKPSGAFIALDGMPITTNAFRPTPPNGYDFYLMVLDRTFSELIYGTYIGGNLANEHVDGGTSRFDKNGVVYQSVCGGCGANSDFPTSIGAWSNLNLSDNCNNVLFKFDFGIIPKAEFDVGNTNGCTDFQVTFQNSSSASDSYLWDFGNGTTSSSIFNPVINYTDPGIYNVYLYVTDSICLLTDTAHVVISVFDSIQLSVNNDTSFCLPIPLVFTANSNGSADYFIWSTDINFLDTLNQSVQDSIYSFTAENSATYYVKAGNGGCDKIDSVHVEVISSEITLNGDDKLCKFDSTSIVAFNTNPSINFTFQWSPSNILFSSSTNDTVKVYTEQSDYLYVDVFDGVSCAFTDSIYIGIGSLLPNVVQASASDYQVPAGATVQLSGEPNGLLYYEWFPSELEIESTQNSSVIINESTAIILKAGDDYCMKNDTIFIEVYPYNCDDPFVFVPTGFSPNGDNENDILFVRGEMIKELTFRVFDRWGAMVFESFDTHIGWDGTFKGKKMDPDVYDYYLEVICLDDQKSFKKGNITLLK